MRIKYFTTVQNMPIFQFPRRCDGLYGLRNNYGPSPWTAESSYRGIRNFTNNKMGITVSELKELRSNLSFTGLRFHCSKKQGRTFHVTTVINSTPVVQYSSGQKDVLPDSCGSFQRTEGDNKSVMECKRWSFEEREAVEICCICSIQVSLVSFRRILVLR